MTKTWYILLAAILSLGASCPGDIDIPSPCPNGVPPVITTINGQPVISCPIPPSPVVTPTPVITPTPASPEPVPSPRPSPSASPIVTTPTPAPSPCVTATGVPCVTKIDGLPAPNCDKCSDWIAHSLSSGALDLCTDGEPGACAGARNRAYNPAPGPEGRDCVDIKTCDMVWCNTGELRNHRYQRDGSVCDPPGCSKTATIATPCPPTPPPASPRPPSPSPGGGGDVRLTESGNLPLPPPGECWSPEIIARYGPVIAEYGVALLSQRKCAGRDAPPDCFITNIHTTPKSLKPYIEQSCYDEQGRYALANCRNKSETLRACQPRPYVNNEGEPDFIGLFIAHPQWNDVFGICDKRTSGECNPVVQDCRNNYICHDQAIGRGGTRTGIMACPPGVPPNGPGCTTSSYGVPLQAGLAARRRGNENAIEPNVPTRPRRFYKDN